MITIHENGDVLEDGKAIASWAKVAWDSLAISRSDFARIVATANRAEKYRETLEHIARMRKPHSSMITWFNEDAEPWNGEETTTISEYADFVLRGDWRKP